MKSLVLVFLMSLPAAVLAQQSSKSADTASPNQFVLFDAIFSLTKYDADHSTPSKSHYYIKGNLINRERPTDWTSPVDFRNGNVHVRVEVLEKPPGDAPTTWSLCYIPNKGQGNGYGCTNTGVYTREGVYEKDVSMTSFWENESIVWTEGVKQMDLVIKDDSGGQGHAHKRSDHEKFFPTKVRISMVQVAAGAEYDPSWLNTDPAYIAKLEVAAMVEKLRQTMVKPDQGTLESIAADKLSYGHSSGIIEDRDQFGKALIDGSSVFTDITLKDQNIALAGNTAIVRHRMLAKTMNNGVGGDVDLNVLTIWQKQDGNWKLLARQAAKTPQ